MSRKTKATEISLILDTQKILQGLTVRLGAVEAAIRGKEEVEAYERELRRLQEHADSLTQEEPCTGATS